ncbi:hypothetical protein VE03_07582 [Pseudogymnoascus sp. 23342-1-I1]|nr:hypothetical protein VE03_07582 [Pseudogymnoascus sp. 23342-1-I1]
MAKNSRKTCFKRQERTEAPAQQLHADGEQLPGYSESQNQEQGYKSTDQSTSNSEKLKVDQGTEAEKWEAEIIEKWNSETKAEKEERRRLYGYNRLLHRLYVEPNESLEKLMKPDLIELLDIVREKALTPPEANIAEQLDKARGKSFATSSIKAQNMPFEKIHTLDLVELLRIARVTPYYRLPKSEFMRVPNSDLVDLLREAKCEFLKRYMVSNHRSLVSRHVEGKKSHSAHEAKLHEDNEVRDMSPTMPSESELELKRLKDLLEKTKLGSDNRLDKVEEQLKTIKEGLVERGCVGGGNVATGSDISTGRFTDSSNAADSNGQIKKEDDPLNQARYQAILETCHAVEKTRELYRLVALLEVDTEQDKYFRIQEFDDVKIKAAGICRGLDDLISRTREDFPLL